MSAGSLIRELDDLGSAEVVFPRNRGHVGEHLEKDLWWVSPSLAVPGDEEMSSTGLPVGRIFNEDRWNTLTHENPLHDSQIERWFVGLGHLASGLTQISFSRLFSKLSAA